VLKLAGKPRPDAGIIAGQTVKGPPGTYYVEWREDRKRRQRPDSTLWSSSLFAVIFCRKRVDVRAKLRITVATDTAPSYTNSMTGMIASRSALTVRLFDQKQNIRLCQYLYEGWLGAKRRRNRSRQRVIEPIVNRISTVKSASRQQPTDYEKLVSGYELLQPDLS
jgi:hypothetical protein